MSPESTPPAMQEPEPLAAFTRCHLGIVSQLEQTAQLASLVDAAQRARQVAQDTLHLFHHVLLPHHADEEAELFPAVLQACTPGERPGVQEMVDRLKREHAMVALLWDALEPAVRAAAHGHAKEIDGELLEQLVRSFLRHARYEETAFLPLAETILRRGAHDLEALDLALHLRHLPPAVGYI